MVRIRKEQGSVCEMTELTYLYIDIGGGFSDKICDPKERSEFASNIFARISLLLLYITHTQTQTQTQTQTHTQPQTQPQTQTQTHINKQRHATQTIYLTQQAISVSGSRMSTLSWTSQQWC